MSTVARKIIVTSCSNKQKEIGLFHLRYVIAFWNHYPYGNRSTKYQLVNHQWRSCRGVHGFFLGQGLTTASQTFYYSEIILGNEVSAQLIEVKTLQQSRSRTFLWIDQLAR